MSRSSLRWVRANHAAAPLGDVALYTGANFTGDVLWLQIGQTVDQLGATFDNRVRSIRFITPAKFYIYSAANQAQHTMCLTSDEADLATRYFTYVNWHTSMTSCSVQPQTYNWPVQPQATYTFGDNSRITPYQTPNLYSNVPARAAPTYTVTYPESQTKFEAAMPPADHRGMLDQAARNACAVLYASPDEIPYRHHQMNIEYIYHDVALATATMQLSRLQIAQTATDADKVASQAWVITHEAVHFYQHAAHYGSNEYVTGIVEGIAEYANIVYGLLPVIYRPPVTDATTWYDGYQTTAFFFDYIVRFAPTPSPNFVRDLNHTLDARDPAIQLRDWTPDLMVPINAGGKTIDQLWSDYRAWLLQ